MTGSDLYSALRAICPEWDPWDTKSNPFNLILPGYETMWRVVLRCYIEVNSRYHTNSDLWQSALRSFALLPTMQQLDAQGHPETSVSARNIAREALRLYPPTRRIYREFELEDRRHIQAAADIEALQRNSKYWKTDPMQFLPERFNDLPADFDIAYMPFGAKPFRCPAKKIKDVEMPFGVSMIALLVGSLLVELKGDWQLKAGLPEKSIPLDTDREAYGTAMLVRKKDV